MINVPIVRILAYSVYNTDINGNVNDIQIVCPYFPPIIINIGIKNNIQFYSLNNIFNDDDNDRRLHPSVKKSRCLITAAVSAVCLFVYPSSWIVHLLVIIATGSLFRHACSDNCDLTCLVPQTLSCATIIK